MKNLYLLVKKFYKFFKIPCKDKILLFQAFFLTGLIRFAILIIAFSTLTKLAGKYKEESPKYLSDMDRFTAKRVSWAVNIISRNTPWESKCLVKALTAQVLLKQKRISSTLYLGVAKDKENKLIAHAWLRSGKDIITGGDEKILFTKVAKFATND
ncbi:lasso peptide biosynthesis B2 protein [Clostridium sp. JS66]|uniref:lasso peptide biosynthesis B2 protein n=1 Tax=Clostridium sp. JS66 TaxID=3064705 RepID=UPI00298E3C8F|nr:lasso peptide biosynthesis B2 protein [Clostridium sp. JS66]WPC43293.1 lasso peptide biosynthesis B2 protein [Clostridium sp. JS66]